MTDMSPETTTPGPDHRPSEHEAWEIGHGTHGDPYHVLGPHPVSGGVAVRVFRPGAEKASVITEAGAVLGTLERFGPEGFFSGLMPSLPEDGHYRLRYTHGSVDWEEEDPYRFGFILGDHDLYYFAQGTHYKLYETLGAHPKTMDGVDGTAFAVLAPMARRVSVVGNFNSWDGRRHIMRRRHECGVWELFIPGVGRGEVYKFEVLGPNNELLPLKQDPVGFLQEMAPSTASVVSGLVEHDWKDQEFQNNSADWQDREKPISIYEVHLGSWRRGAGNAFLTYDELAETLPAYVKEMGFTHVEFMPVSEHPFYGSWGYQPIGLYAPTSRFGSPEAFARLVDTLHQEGIGVLLDWVPGHFPTDVHGLGWFDGTALYEHPDPRKGFHQDWNTLIFNYGRTEIKNYLVGNGLYWLDRFHIDGLRVDAVASMLYLDYSRKAGEWEPNIYGGRENLEAMAFLKEANEKIGSYYPKASTHAEESTAFPGVSTPTYLGGLGFHFKWNMGWMHDTLHFMQEDPVHRRYHYHNMTFGMVYAYSENFILPLSHDEVVYGKGSLLEKMPGDRWQKFANLRAYFGFMWAHPGKKLIFMGGEFGQSHEWQHDYSLDWHLLQYPEHKGVQSLMKDLNAFYRDTPAMHQLDCDPAGFEWVDAANADQTVLAFLRKDRDGNQVLIVSNFTPVPRHDHRLGVPTGGTWVEKVNTDREAYAGSNLTNPPVKADEVPAHGRPYSVKLTLPPLATIMLMPEGHG
ncbi:1,4-alpha-glucan branching protein GlgB [Consotaella sp. CSK11QG-6]